MVISFDYEIHSIINALYCRRIQYRLRQFHFHCHGTMAMQAIFKLLDSMSVSSV
jgi:hypothetical protein